VLVVTAVVAERYRKGLLERLLDPATKVGAAAGAFGAVGAGAAAAVAYSSSRGLSGQVIAALFFVVLVVFVALIQVQSAAIEQHH
jgi:hypothetical protein